VDEGIKNALNEELGEGNPRKPFSPSFSNIRYPVATIEIFFLKDSGIAHLQNMRNAVVMLRNRVALKRKVDLPTPYGEAFIFSKVPPLDCQSSSRLTLCRY
jgi:hypothetical protein